MPESWLDAERSKRKVASQYCQCYDYHVRLWVECVRDISNNLVFERERDRESTKNEATDFSLRASMYVFYSSVVQMFEPVLETSEDILCESKCQWNVSIRGYEVRTKNRS